MPRFTRDNYACNLKLLEQTGKIARQEGCTQAQLALAWLLAQGDDIIAIPGTTSLAHLKENIESVKVELSAGAIHRLDQIINNSTVTGERYNSATQAEIDTEEFASG